MSDRALRGERLGSESLISEHGVEFAERKVVEYVTADGHKFQVLFEIDATPPAEWDDPRSGQTGYLPDAEGEAARLSNEEKEAGARTHWDMLLERRTREELEELLEERLKHLRARRGQES